MDGNNSLKRMRPLGGRKVGDPRVFQESDYFLSQEFVNTFAHEVPPRSRRSDNVPGAEELAESSDRMDLADGALDPVTVSAPPPRRVDRYLTIIQVSGAPSDPPDTSEQSVFENVGVTDPPPPNADSPEVLRGDSPAPEGVYPGPPPAERPQAVEVEGDPTDGAPGVESSCTKNWKAAQSDEKKRSWDVFEETGIFASACRHGLILWLVDMIRSGEL